MSVSLGRENLIRTFQRLFVGITIFTALLSGRDLSGQVLGRSMNISLSYQSIQGESISTNAGDVLTRVGKLEVSDIIPKKLTLDFGIRQPFNYGLFLDYKFQFIPYNMVSLDKYDSHYSYNDFVYFDAVINGNIGFDLFKNLL